MPDHHAPLPWPELADLAGRQYGLITASQAVTLGMAETTLRRNLARGWHRPHEGVYALPGAVAPARQRVMAALLAIGGEVYASRWTAAWLHGLVRSPPSRVQVTVPYERGVPALAGVETRRSRTWRWEDTVAVDDLVVAAPARMLGELAACTNLSYLRSLAIDVRQRRLASLDGIAAALERMGPVSGAGRLRRILWQLDEERCDSELERVARAAFRARPHIPSPHPQPYPIPVRGRIVHIDLGWPDQEVGIDCLGLASHSQREHLEVDSLRSGLLAETTWRIFTVTWRRIETDAESFCAQIHQALQPPPHRRL